MFLDNLWCLQLSVRVNHEPLQHHVGGPALELLAGQTEIWLSLLSTGDLNKSHSQVLGSLSLC